ncbi:hypothetical protein PVAP13_8NG130600 [Panicum virgatum]|uniref:Uncharacterized protein n=1 Tax=Panicum virgatum TaxID=38727 RepID=A0A8T0PB49_PANVG|nr:hypothetical protein PVAP13_8NG130600 [Panicum virgatum]
MALVRMGRKRLAYLTVSLFLLVLVATMASTSQSLETEGCFGRWCGHRPPRAPRPPRLTPFRRPCFPPYNWENCNDRGCRYTCREHGHQRGGYCSLDQYCCNY